MTQAYEAYLKAATRAGTGKDRLREIERGVREDRYLTSGERGEVLGVIEGELRHLEGFDSGAAQAQESQPTAREEPTWPPTGEEIAAATEKVKAAVPDPALSADLALMPKTALDTPEKMRWAADLAIAQYREFERVKAATLQEGRDYIYICKVHRADREHPYEVGEHGDGEGLCRLGHVHIKIGGAEKLGSYFSVNLRKVSEEMTRNDKGELVEAAYEHEAEWNGRKRTKSGTCTMAELYEKTSHNLKTKAESRSQRRAILAVLGAADPAAHETVEDEE